MNFPADLDTNIYLLNSRGAIVVTAPGKTLMTATVPRLTSALARLEVMPN